MKKNYKKITTVGMFCAMAYIIVAVLRIPIIPGIPFLTYEPKDIILTIAGFIYGPITAVLSSVIVAFIEMVTISQTGIIGFIMNVLSTCSFSVTASFIYKKKHTIFGAVWGLITGVLAMVTIMLLWNYLITPLYMNLPREQIVALLIPAFLPFNLIKGILNASITLVVYKPLVKALRSANLIPPEMTSKNKISAMGIVLISAVIVANCIFVILVLNKVI